MFKNERLNNSATFIVFLRRNEKWKRGKKSLPLFLNYEFNRITFISKNHTRHERLVKGNSFIRNTKIHSIHNKWELTLCRVHHNTNTVSCVNILSISVFFLMNWELLNQSHIYPQDFHYLKLYFLLLSYHPIYH